MNIGSILDGIKIATMFVAIFIIFIQYEEIQTFKAHLENCSQQVEVQNKNIENLHANAMLAQNTRDKLEKNARNIFEAQEKTLAKADIVSTGTTCEDARIWGIQQGLQF